MLKTIENPFSEARIRHYTSMSFNQFYSLTYKDFLVGELEYIIAQTPMRDEDKRMAVMFYIKGMSSKEVAEACSICYDCAKSKKKELHEALIYTLIKLFCESEKE